MITEYTQSDFQDFITLFSDKSLIVILIIPLVVSIITILLNNLIKNKK